MPLLNFFYFFRRLPCCGGGKAGQQQLSDLTAVASLASMVSVAAKRSGAEAPSVVLGIIVNALIHRRAAPPLIQAINDRF